MPDNFKCNSIGKKSWFGYIKVVIWSILIGLATMFIGSIILSLIAQYVKFDINSALSIFLLVVIPIFIVYKILDLRSYKLYCDDEGVWLYSGILPWTKGVYGVSWRDLDSANYKIGFLSWLTNSYDVVISHRFTKNNEIYIKDIWNGKKLVPLINQQHNIWLSEHK